MRDFRRFSPWLLALVCLPFTGRAVAWADSARSPRADYYIEDPMAPHRTTGTTARLGTAAGFIYNERLDVFALGAAVAGGHRWGRLAIEAEYAYLGFQERGPSSLSLGDGQRLGVIGRLDVIRLGPQIVGGNSLVSLYVEGGAAVAWNDWYLPAHDEPARIVPDDTRRVEGQVGFGIHIDHRLQEPIGLPHRVGWFLGWRLGLSPHEADPASICRGSSGVSCRAAPKMPEEEYVDRSMLFQSSLSMMW